MPSKKLGRPLRDGPNSRLTRATTWPAFARTAPLRVGLGPSVNRKRRDWIVFAIAGVFAVEDEVGRNEYQPNARSGREPGQFGGPAMIDPVRQVWVAGTIADGRHRGCVQDDVRSRRPQSIGHSLCVRQINRLDRDAVNRDGVGPAPENDLVATVEQIQEKICAQLARRACDENALGHSRILGSTF